MLEVRAVYQVFLMSSISKQFDACERAALDLELHAADILYYIYPIPSCADGYTRTYLIKKTFIFMYIFLVTTGRCARARLQ
jgi:hypothetical protein